ncbi:MAG: pyruvate dehydrogenase complex dihydrolipoamide acetyltransferase [Alphaproteobacteria bacterium]|jgi:pyruvate dehydrogenase E2 component (dihydrolipoamide acetyltransferase)|nr:pyruvate dehydrogenase complex dihydrolipoamide acetyltransferase [Alphaproteobacteria bacterium]
MPIKILMPALSPTMTEGKLSKWVKKEGDKIKSGDIIAEIETDKATMEYEATEDGILGKILIADGAENVAVNTLIGVMLEDGEDAGLIDSFVAANSSGGAAKSSAPAAAPAAATTTASAPAPVATSNNGSKVFITPLAKRIAQQNSVDVAALKGSGPNGRIIKVDVESALAGGVSSATATATTAVPAPSLGGHAAGSYEDKPNSGMRKTIAKRLLESKNTIPHYYLTIDCNMETILKARASLNDISKDKYKLSVNDFIIKAVAMAMIDVPEANSSWLGDTTRYYKTADVAVAVATPTGLFTPIVWEAEKKGLVQISLEMKDLAARAKDGKLKPSEYQGGGFSISNLGMMGIKDFCAIINPPHAGILAIGTTEKRAIVVKDAVVIANMMSVTISADHRVMDGAVAAKFLNAFKGYIENPVSMIL